MLLSPIINWFLLNRNYIWYIFVLLIVIGIALFGLKAFMYFKFIWVFTIWYVVGGIIRLYELDKRSTRFEYILVSFIVLAFLFIVFTDLLYINKGIDIRQVNSHFWRFSPIPIIGAAGIFIIFSKLRFDSPKINLLAKSAFGIYLITENPNIYPWLWKIKLFDNMTFYNTYYLIPISIVLCLIVMVVCLFVDIVKNKCGSYIISLVRK